MIHLTSHTPSVIFTRLRAWLAAALRVGHAQRRPRRLWIVRPEEAAGEAEEASPPVPGQASRVKARPASAPRLYLVPSPDTTAEQPARVTGGGGAKGRHDGAEQGA
jgi:hypothetical protein